MRISNQLKSLFIELIQTKLAGSKVILFGSRTKDNAFGGDFDLAIKGEFSDCEFNTMKIYFFKQLLLKDLDLPVDLINYNQTKGLFKQEIDKGIIL
jgi:predicted nucleotidyltransferase